MNGSAAAPATAVRRWQPFGIVLLVLALGLFAFWPSFTALAELWSHPERRTYQHGYVIVALALWLIWRERQRLAAAVSVPSWLLLGAALLAVLGWWIAMQAGLQVVHFALWPVILWCVLAGALGWRAGRVLLFPVGFLYFGIPVWDALVPALQWATVAANHLLTSLTGITALIEGNEIHIPEGSFAIEGGCSGLNYLLAGTAVGALLGEVNRDPPLRRALLIAVASGMAILSNWLRVYIVILAGHLTDMQHYLVRVNHYDFGWVLFAFVLVGYFLLVRRLPATVSPAVEHRPAVVRVSPAAVAAVVVLLSAVGLAQAPRGRSDAIAALGPTGGGEAAPAIPGWQAETPFHSWRPVFPGADQEWRSDYYRGGDRVTVFQATYLRQQQGRELIGHESHVEGTGAGRMLRVTPVSDAGNPPLPWLEAEWQEEPSGRRYMLWWVYRIGTRSFTGGLPAQLWYGVASLWSEPESTVLVLRADCLPDCAAARALLREFGATARPVLREQEVSRAGR